MAYDERLADRIRAVLGKRTDVSERKMFGGLAFLVGGHMCVGIVGKDLMVRVGKEAFEEAVRAPHARRMDFTGTPSKGMVYVAPAGLKTAPALRSWVEKGITLVATLPERTGGGPSGRKRAERKVEPADHPRTAVPDGRITPLLGGRWAHDQTAPHAEGGPPSSACRSGL